LLRGDQRPAAAGDGARAQLHSNNASAGGMGVAGQVRRRVMTSFLVSGGGAGAYVRRERAQGVCHCTLSIGGMGGRAGAPA
jgi:hypothetical protein